jgi:PAS domain-containing protein
VLPTRTHHGALRLVVFNKPREYVDDLLRAVLDATPEGILGLRCVRSADGRIDDAMVITANERAASIMRRTVETLLDRPILEILPKLRQSSTWAHYLAVVENRAPHRFETSFVVGGQVRWLDVKVVPLGDGLLLSIGDITKFKDACRKLEMKNVDLVRANSKLARK